MKIGILTLPLYSNYGGILQAYALQTVLERMGHKVSVLDYNRRAKYNFAKRIALYFKRFVLHNVIHKSDVPVFYEEKVYKEAYYKFKNVWNFVDFYINRLPISDPKQLHDKCFDAIVVGSDQIWRPEYFMGWYIHKEEDVFLDFAKEWNITRIAYAASFGNGEWSFSDSATTIISKLVKKFDLITVRENSAIEILNEKLNFKTASTVLDPTLLLEKEDYLRLLNEVKTNEVPSIVAYVLDESPFISNVLNNVVNKLNLPIKEANKSSCDGNVKPSIENWLLDFALAEFVITDSYHACVFSIIFEKPFIVVANKNRGCDRFYTLLKEFNLLDRLITEQSGNMPDFYIDYTTVKKKLQQRKGESLNMLIKTLI